MEKTKWFPAEIKPKRKGIYEVWSLVFNQCGWFCHWDGKKWGYAYQNINWAYDSRNKTSETQYRHWRGLSEPS